MLKLIKRNILYEITEEEIMYLIDNAIYVTNKKHTQMQLLNDKKKMTKKNINDIIFYTDENNKLLDNREIKIKLKTK